MKALTEAKIGWWLAGAAMLGAALTAVAFQANAVAISSAFLGVFALFIGGKPVSSGTPCMSKIEQVREFAALLCRNLPSGILLMDQDERVLFANEQALRLFGRKAEEIHGRLLANLADAKSGETSPGLIPAHRFRKADGSLFYAHVSEAPVEIPESSGPLRLRILIVSDITGVVDMQRRVQQAERLRTAATMATQFAHEVRNPVAAISGSAQVLEKLQRVNEARNTISDVDRAQLYKCIVSESDRLDEIITKFLSVAEFSDERLEQLLHLPELSHEPALTPTHAIPPPRQPEPSHAA